VAELSEAEQLQLVIAWEFYTSETNSAEELLTDNPGWFELWAVEHDGQVEFDFWHLPPDSGTVFFHGWAAGPGIGMIQFGFDYDEARATGHVPDPDAFTKALDLAWRNRPRTGLNGPEQPGGSPPLGAR
jgi:hypothetical protein